MSEANDIRERQLREELGRLSTERLPQEALSTFSGRLVQTQMERRKEDLRAELDALVDRRLVVRFADPLDQQAIDTTLLSQLLGRLQSAINHVGWALRAGPGTEGDPPATISSRTATQVLATAAGSFEVVLRGSMLELIEPTTDEGESELDALLEVSLSRILELAHAAAEEDFTDSLEELTQELGAQPTRRLSLWFKKLAENSLTADLVLGAHPERSVTVTPPQSRALAEWLEHVQDSVESITVRGVLRIADDVRGRFGIEDAAEILYEGKAAPDLVQHKEIGVQYVAEIQASVKVSPHTGARSEKYNLTSLKPVEVD